MAQGTRDKRKQNGLLLASTAVIVAGTIILVRINSSNTQEVQGDFPKEFFIQTAGSQPTTVFSTTAGVADLLDNDLLQSVQKATAGVADILDEEPAAEAYITAVQDENTEESEYANLAIAKVNNYVNVRSAPNTDSEVVGKMYDGSVAQILSTAGDNNEWFQVVSGSVEGYIKAEYFIYGDDAVAVIDDYVTRYAVVQADRLNVREEPDISSGRIGYIDNGERVRLLEWGDEWSKVDYAAEHTGYVASEYVTVAEEFIYAKSIEEEQAELAALRELQARTQASEEAAPERMVVSTPPPQTNFATVSELRTAVVNYAMQYLGNR